MIFNIYTFYLPQNNARFLLCACIFSLFFLIKELPAKFAIPLPDMKPEYLALMASAMTADMAYQECGPLKAGQSVLVTGVHK